MTARLHVNGTVCDSLGRSAVWNETHDSSRSRLAHPERVPQGDVDWVMLQLRARSETQHELYKRFQRDFPGVTSHGSRVSAALLLLRACGEIKSVRDSPARRSPRSTSVFMSPLWELA